MLIIISYQITKSRKLFTSKMLMSIYYLYILNDLLLVILKILLYFFYLLLHFYCFENLKKPA